MDEKRRRRESILSVAAKWLPWCLSLVFVLTIAWAIFVASVEIASGERQSGSEIVVAVAIKTATVLPLIILCAVFITTMLDIAGGGIMVTARYLTEKFLDPWREKVKAEIKAEVKDQVKAEIKAEVKDQVKAEVKAEAEAEGKAQGIEVGKTQGLAQKQREWETWLREKEDADERGEPFDDPPPSL